MDKRCDILLIPGDTPPDPEVIKKLILFFDSITLANPYDNALVLDREGIEKIGNFTLWMSTRNSFPRSHDYFESMREILSQVSSLNKNGIIRVTPKTAPSNIDSGMNYVLWHSVIANKNIVEAAVPDRFSGNKPPNKIENYMLRAVMKVNGITSKYDIAESRPPVKLIDVDEEWSMYSHLRIGRALKFLRYSNALGLIPMAIDEPNMNILSVSQDVSHEVSYLSQDKNLKYKAPLINIDYNLLDNGELLKNLKDISWTEVRKLRKHTLPGMHKLRSHLYNLVKLQSKINTLDAEIYQNELFKLNLEYSRVKDEVAKDWESLRIATVLRGAGVIGGAPLIESSGLIASVVATPWMDMLIKIFALGLVSASTATKELQALIPARRALKQHPLYFTEKLLK